MNRVKNLQASLTQIWPNATALASLEQLLEALVSK
jgi:hypothetical protein